LRTTCLCFNSISLTFIWMVMSTLFPTHITPSHKFQNQSTSWITSWKPNSKVMTAPKAKSLSSAPAAQQDILSTLKVSLSTRWTLACQALIATRFVCRDRAWVASHMLKTFTRPGLKCMWQRANWLLSHEASTQKQDKLSISMESQSVTLTIKSEKSKVI
jgi:hypothetical protein